MNKEDLLELRETFRKRFREEDFCIGEAQVERLFRELLGEPEEVEIYHIADEAKLFTAKDLEYLMDRAFTKEKVNAIFEADSVLYSKLKK